MMRLSSNLRRFRWVVFAAWLLLLVSVVPLRWLGASSQSRLAIAAGALLKTRLLSGALFLVWFFLGKWPRM